MFDAIAPRYDRANRVISLGMDLRWRREVVRLALKKAPRIVLDVGAGTGDLARKVDASGEKDDEIIGVDLKKSVIPIREP